ncbi:hypothetical protein O3M35_006750 [Rhynocoris fuscipes]|uniref:V-type proton ATPase subunit n=1 Tax=Rhynocoris fuscipes TaxID=488301 RepID=A0AAW1CKW7_9HEMI
MGFAFIPCALITSFWAVIGIVLPLFLPKGTNRALIQLSLVLTAVCAWLFWLCAYMAQMNPLVGPKLRNTTILMIASEWGNKVEL